MLGFRHAAGLQSPADNGDISETIKICKTIHFPERKGQKGAHLQFIKVETAALQVPCGEQQMPFSHLSPCQCLLSTVKICTYQKMARDESYNTYALLQLAFSFLSVHTHHCCRTCSQQRSWQSSNKAPPASEQSPRLLPTDGQETPFHTLLTLQLITHYCR